jgi:hypothetical protein
MPDFEALGAVLRSDAKALVLEFMSATSQCRPGREGVKQAEIFRRCGFDWGGYEKATSSHQQYWVVALLRELEAEGRVEQVSASGPWRLR